MEELPLCRTAALVPEFAVKDLMIVMMYKGLQEEHLVSLKRPPDVML